MPAPLIGLAPATAAVMRIAAQQGIKLTTKEAAKLAAKRSNAAGLRAATSGSGMPMAGMNQSALRMVMSNPHMKAFLAGAGSIPVGVGTLLYNMNKEDEEPVVEEEGIESLIEKDNDFANGGTVRRRVPDVYFQRYKDGGEAKSFPDLNNDGDVTYADVLKGRGVNFRDGGSVYNIGDPGPYGEQMPGKGGPDEFMRKQRKRRKSSPARPQTLPSQNIFPETQEEKIRRMDQELLRMMDEDDTAMSEMFDDINQRTQQDPADGSDTTYGDDTFARQLYEMEQRKKMQEILDSLEPGEGLAHGGAVRPRGYNMGGAVMPQPQKPQGIATMMTDPRTNMGNMPNQQQQQLSALQTTANAANLNANNLQKSMQAQQQQAMRGNVTTPLSQVRIPSTKRRQFEDTLLNSRRRGQKAGQIAQRRASIPATIFG